MRTSDFWSRKQNGKAHLQDFGIDGSTIKERILKKQDVRSITGLNAQLIKPSCEHDKKAFSSILARGS